MTNRRQCIRFITFYFLLLLIGTSVYAQNKTLLTQLQQSDNLRITMKADSADAAMTRWLAKKVESSRELPLATDFSTLRIKGPGTLKVDHTNTISGKGSILLETPTSLGTKNPTNRSYASAELIRPLNRENLGAYNRFSVWVYADAPGFYSFFIGCTLYNEGKHVMPTPGRFEGQHFVTVYPHQWQHIIWEIPDLYRDAVTGFSVNIMLTGSPKGADERMKLYVDDMRIEKVAAENTRGFNLRKDAIAYSHSGYKTDAVKQALVQNVAGTGFQLLDSAGKVAFTGEGRKLENGFVQFNFSNFNNPGYYTLRSNNVTTKPFAIGPEAYLATAWRTLNFFFAERCGYDQPGIHQSCHEDVACVHPDGRTIGVSGGWHDAADLTQGVGNTARGGMAMLELAQSVKKNNPALYKRLIEEARWGLDWTLKTRFGDGYRDGGLIVGIWTDNTIGTKDDMQGKASNNPSDNFISASYCAKAVPFYEQEDPVFAELCHKAAIEDFRFANDLLVLPSPKRMKQNFMQKQWYRQCTYID